MKDGSQYRRTPSSHHVWFKSIPKCRILLSLFRNLEHSASKNSIWTSRVLSTALAGDLVTVGKWSSEVLLLHRTRLELLFSLLLPLAELLAVKSDCTSRFLFVRCLSMALVFLSLPFLMGEANRLPRVQNNSRPLAIFQHFTIWPIKIYFGWTHYCTFAMEWLNTRWHFLQMAIKIWMLILYSAANTGLWIIYWIAFHKMPRANSSMRLTTSGSSWKTRNHCECFPCFVGDRWQENFRAFLQELLQTTYTWISKHRLRSHKTMLCL